MADYQRITSPPESITSGPLLWYLREVARAINDIPQISATSTLNPNDGTHAGYPGDLLVNLVSTSTDKRLLVMGGSLRVKQTSGWVAV